MNPTKAVGIVRVSSTSGREGIASPETQRAQIEAACKRENLTLIAVHEEVDVSGGKPLADRPGLREAVAAIESGEAEVIAAAYFDRLFRSLTTQAEVLERVEQAGGQVLAVDVGRVSNGSATKWLSGTLLGAFAEYYRRTTGERVREAHIRAVARGVVPYPGATPGYRRTDEGKLIPDPVAAPIVADAFELRADGGTVAEVRELLADGGVLLSYAGVARLLSSRVVLGELHFGDLHNLDAHPAIVDRAVWNRVQRLVVTRGRNGKSNRLLARLGILRCGSCGARMIVGTANQTFYTYRCPPTGDCDRRVTISAQMVERVVVETVQVVMDALEADYTIADKAAAKRQRAQQDLASAQTNYVAAMDAMQDWTDAAAVAKLAELKSIVDDMEDKFARMPNPRPQVQVFDHWNDLALEDQRDYIRTFIDSVIVHPGRGPERIDVVMAE
jgi:DNA invertase Pin-like site-specific DNA recombinase